MIETVARRLIIIIVTTSTVGVLTGVVIGRYAIPNNPKSPDTASVAPLPTPTGPATTAPTATLVPSPEPTTATPEQPSDSTSQIPGLPTRINQLGIPVGYPHSEAGAVSACANYVAAYTKDDNREPTRLHQVLRSISISNESADKLSQRLIDANAGTAKNFSIQSVYSPNFRLSFTVLGYKAAAYKSDRNTVTIWLNAVAGVINGNPDLQPRDFWGTDLCTIDWNGSDWRISDVNDGPDGPDPAEQRSEEFRRFLPIGAGK
ncbi:hypothetical protein [Frankia sp. R82]|uniref:hypothetical protein n=1 Tax=Frankia sp. R82 TaxID=2950553 RepID=UPI0020445B60|nr:hypothetical protein [Frankia sp. R82]MCM3885942.1 hypothetical protein [Frankia sp. R82]